MTADPADRLVFSLDQAAWEKFNALLQRPAAPIPALTALFAEPAPWDE